MNEFGTNHTCGGAGLAQQLEHLEKQTARLAARVRRLNAIVAVIVIFAGAGWLCTFIQPTQAGGGANAAKVLRASAFVIVDQKGVERGSFAYNDAEQGTVLNLQPDKNGRMSVGVGRGYVGLRLTRGKNDINMGCIDKGGTYLEMFDKDGNRIFEQRKP